MAMPTIKSATSADEAAVIAVITLAFSTDPVVRWVYPNPQQYLTAMPLLVKAVGGKAIAHGSAYYVEGYAGAALWLPPDVHPNAEELSAVIQRTVAERERGALPAIAEQRGKYHPTEPYWDLRYIGVEAMHQGHGYGAALMEHALGVCDRDQRLAYLESSNPRNISLYQRHGFEVLGTIQVGTAPPLFPMLRKPQ
jgi:ribosomal protein S18 acetylase RimI-like enzyme